VQKKWEKIRSWLLELNDGKLEGMKILDVGANAGFYTFSLAQEGAVVTAFEPHPRYSKIGAFLAVEKKLDVSWNGRAFDPESVAGRSFDAALLLSTFQWMASGGKDLEPATEQLRTISAVCKYTIFELGFNAGKSAIPTDKWNHYAELIGLLRRSTSYDSFKLIGTTRLWRSCKRYLVLCSNDPSLDDGFINRLIRGKRA